LCNTNQAAKIFKRKLKLLTIAVLYQHPAKNLV